jgi:hypothetical protein
MPQAGLETLISVSVLQQAHALDREAIGTVYELSTIVKIYLIVLNI